MRGARLTLELPLEAMTHANMPPNVEVLARVYVGDQCFGLARDPKNRALFLLSLSGYWRLDTQQLVATFADSLREWDRELEIARGAASHAIRELEPAAPLLPRRSPWGGIGRATVNAHERRGKRKAG